MNRVVKKAIFDELEGRRATVDRTLLREGDLIEYLSIVGGTRIARVQEVRPRAPRIVIGNVTRDDLPYGSKSLAPEPWTEEIHESQTKGIIVERRVARPGDAAFSVFVARRQGVGQ